MTDVQPMNSPSLSTLDCADQAQVRSEYRAIRQHGLMTALEAYAAALASVRFYAAMRRNARRATLNA